MLNGKITDNAVPFYAEYGLSNKTTLGNIEIRIKHNFYNN